METNQEQPKHLPTTEPSLSGGLHFKSHSLSLNPLVWREESTSGEHILASGYEPQLESDAETGKELNEIEWQKVKVAREGVTKMVPKAGDWYYHEGIKEYVKLDKQEMGNSDKN